MAEPTPHLTLVPPPPPHLADRLAVLIGREPTPLEVRVFARWRVALALGITRTSRRRSRRVIARW